MSQCATTIYSKTIVRNVLWWPFSMIFQSKQILRNIFAKFLQDFQFSYSALKVFGLYFACIEWKCKAISRKGVLCDHSTVSRVANHDNCYCTLAEEWSDLRLIPVLTMIIILLSRTDSLKKRLANVNQAITQWVSLNNKPYFLLSS